MKKIIHKLNLNTALLLSIIISGFILRIYNLSDNPAGFFCDEASVGYNAYSILNTGKDEYGVSFPVFFQSFGDYRPPLAVYSAIPFIALFGLNEFSTRLPSVFYGLLTIISIYFIGNEISSKKNKSLGLLAAFTTTVMPWLIHYNRTGFEFTVYVAFFTFTILLLLKTIRNKSFIIPAFIFASLTFYTYQPAKLLIPLLLVGFLFIYRTTFLRNPKYTIIGLISLFILSLPLISTFFNGEAVARFNRVSVLSLNLSFMPTLKLIIINYLTQLSPSYFIIGEPTIITRHFIRGLAPLLVSTMPFLLIGIIYIFLTIRQKTSQFLLYWLLIYPIAGAITAGAPFTSRSLIGAPLFALLISLGISVVIPRVNKFIAYAIFTLFLLELVVFVKFYFTLYPLYSYDYLGWQYGARDIVQYFASHQKNYDDLIMSPDFNAPDIFFKFYAPNNCAKCRLGVPDNSFIKGKKQLFAVSPDYMTSHAEFIYKPVKTIYYPDGKVAYILSEITE